MAAYDVVWKKQIGSVTITKLETEHSFIIEGSLTIMARQAHSKREDGEVIDGFETRRVLDQLKAAIDRLYAEMRS